VETAAAEIGLNMRQDPKEARNWMATHRGNQTAGGYWLSLDYTDFNKEHRWWEQSFLNLALAQAWDDASCVGNEDRARCSRYVAWSYTSRTARRGDDKKRILHGLFSGERNTARDNTLLHYVYHKIVLDALGELGVSARVGGIWVCGDDEDGLYATKEEAALVMATTMTMGWHLNPAKQLGGYNDHEFLQFRMTEDRLFRATAPLSVSLANWSWYKEPLAEWTSLPTAAARHTREIAARGGDFELAWKLHRKALNSISHLLYQRHVRWDQLLNDRDRQWLQLDLVGGAADNSQIYRIAQHAKNLNPPGRQALLRRAWPLLSLLREGERTAVMQQADNDAMASWFGTLRRKMREKPNLQYGKVPITTPTVMPRIGVMTAIDIEPANWSVMTIEQAAGIAGLPPALLRAVWKNRKRLGWPEAVVGIMADVDPGDFDDNQKTGFCTQSTALVPWWR